MKVCFHHQDFDRDVSSGTTHAMYQWYELFNAFGVDEVAIINQTEDVIPYINGNIKTTVYGALSEFVDANATADLTYVEKGGTLHTTFDFTQTDWIIIGGTGGLPKSDVSIDTGVVSLYPREAAAIILAAIKWQ